MSTPREPSVGGIVPEVVLDDEVRARIRILALWVDDVRVEEHRAAFGELEAAAAQWRTQHGHRPIGQIPGVGDARRLYQAFGVDPTRTRPSSEALLRRALKQLELYHVSNIVDVGNAASLAALLPLGLYDRDAIVGPRAVVRVGRAGEQYEGIRKGAVHLQGRLTVADAEGPFGSPTSDSFRARITPQTQRLLVIVFAPAEIDSARLQGAGDRLQHGFARHAGGRTVARLELPGP